MIATVLPCSCWDSQEANGILSWQWLVVRNLVLFIVNSGEEVLDDIVMCLSYRSNYISPRATFVWRSFFAHSLPMTFLLLLRGLFLLITYSKTAVLIMRFSLFPYIWHHCAVDKLAPVDTWQCVVFICWSSCFGFTSGHFPVTLKHLQTGLWVLWKITKVAAMTVVNVL